MSNAEEPQPAAPDANTHHHGDDTSAAEAGAGMVINRGLANALQAGASGETLSGAGLLAAIGGWRGVAEAMVPGILFLCLYLPTQDARLSAAIPGALAVVLVVVRLVRREPLVSAISGMLGVGIAVLITLITGRGIDYYLSGFVINAVWALGLFVSLIVRWPLMGFVIGIFRGSVTGWRSDHALRRAATLLTLLWLAMFVARLAVQLPFYLNEQVEALGIARLVMGTPLYALLVVATWVWARRAFRSSDELRESRQASSSEIEEPGEA